MSKIIIYANENGGVSLCIPSGEITIDEVLSKDCPAGAIIVEEKVLKGKDYDFFDAWELNGNEIIVSMQKAREIWKQKLAIEAEAKIEELNKLYHVYIDEGKDPAPVIEKRKMLRNITNDKAIASAKTVEDLKTFWPEVLTAPVGYPLAIVLVAVQKTDQRT